MLTRIPWQSWAGDSRAAMTAYDVLDEIRYAAKAKGGPG